MNRYISQSRALNAWYWVCDFCGKSTRRSIFMNQVIEDHSGGIRNLICCLDCLPEERGQLEIEVDIEQLRLPVHPISRLNEKQVADKAAEIHEKQEEFPIPGSVEYTDQAYEPGMNGYKSCGSCWRTDDVKHIRYWSRLEFVTSVVDIYLCKRCRAELVRQMAELDE